LKRGLKAKWDEVNKKYQQMTHIQNLDTIGLRRRYCIIEYRNSKDMYEKELIQIEKDLEKLSKP
jgi:hypothetical protein